ncbi:MAG: hypothetical protein AB7Q00_12025 [Phycisphaerales bacterium]
MPTRPRRHLALLVAFYFSLGILTTLLTCWTLGLTGRFTDGELNAGYDEPNHSIPQCLIPKGWEPRTHQNWTGFGIRHDLVSEAEWHGSALIMTTDDRPQRTLQTARVGWPFLSMRWERYNSETALDTSSPLRRRYLQGLEIPGMANVWPQPRKGAWGVEPRLPLQPVWPSFLYSSLTYAALFFAILNTIAFTRRARRRRRNQCVTCGYTLDALTTCPECGTPAPPQCP